MHNLKRLSVQPYVNISLLSTWWVQVQKIWPRFCLLPNFPTAELSVVQSRFQGMSDLSVLRKANVQLNIHSSMGMSAVCVYYMFWSELLGPNCCCQIAVPHWQLVGNLDCYFGLEHYWDRACLQWTVAQEPFHEHYRQMAWTPLTHTSHTSCICCM